MYNFRNQIKCPLFICNKYQKKSLPFEIKEHNYLWNKINTKVISEVTFWITDDENRQVDLNGIDISLTYVMKEA